MQKTSIKKSVILLILLTLLIGHTTVTQTNIIEMIEIFFQEELEDEYFAGQVLQQMTVEESTEIRAEYTDGLGEFKR